MPFGVDILRVGTSSGSCCLDETKRKYGRRKTNL